MMNEHSALEDSTLLVVGGAGFVGSNLVKKLLQHKVKKVIVVDNLISSEVSNLPSGDHKLEFLFGDICDNVILNKLSNEIDYVFHLATYHGNHSSINNPMADHDNNLLPTLKLCEYLLSNKRLKKIVYSSAGCGMAKKTYDVTQATQEIDSVSLYQDTPYQISKVVGEIYGNYYWSQYGLPFVKARFQNVYGQNEVLGAGVWRGVKQTVWRNVIPTFIWKALNNEELPVENGGLASRDFIHVDDVVDGLLSCLLNGDSGQAYNIASGVNTTILDLANEINRISGNSTPFNYQPAREWDRSGFRYGSTKKSREQLNFSAKVSLQSGLSQTIDWTKDNFERIRATVLKHEIFMPELGEYR